MINNSTQVKNQILTKLSGGIIRYKLKFSFKKRYEISFLEKILIKDLYVFNHLFNNQMKVKEIKDFNKYILDTDEAGGLKIKFWDEKNKDYKTFLVSDTDFFDANYKLEPLSIKWQAFLYLKLGNNYLEHLENKNGISFLREESEIINRSENMKKAVEIVEEIQKSYFNKNEKFFNANVIEFVNYRKQNNKSEEKSL